MLINENLFAIEYVDLAARHFPVYQQEHADFSHGFEGREDLVDAGDTGIGVGGCTGRIQLGGVHEATGFRGTDVFRRGLVGEVQHHQRLEAAAGRACSQNALTIGIGLLRVAHRRHEVGHDDCAAKSSRYVSNGMRQDSSVTEVNVPVVGTQEGQAVRHWGFQAGQTRWECYRKRLSQASAIKFCTKLPIAPLSVSHFLFRVYFQWSLPCASDI